MFWIFKRKNKLPTVRLQSESSVRDAFKVLLGINGGGQIGNNYNSQAREGYQKNVIAYHCVNSIAQSISSIPVIVEINGKEQDPKLNPIANLIDDPNPRQTYERFMYELVMHRLISGNSYIREISVGGREQRVAELWLLRPDKVEIVTQNDIPVGYRYTSGNQTMLFPIDRSTFMSEVLHIKLPNPLDDLYGMSPVQAASMGIMQHNSANVWNQKMLENDARPPGIVTFDPDTAGALPPRDEDIDRINKAFNSKYSGAENARKVLFLNQHMKYQQIAFSPADMDWISGKNTTARDIALAFGYPPHLLGMAEGSTFSNVAEAKLHLYQSTVIPHAETVLSELAHWLSQKLGQEIELKLDLNDVEALATLRDNMQEQVRKNYQANVITLNEARRELGYDEITEEWADKIMVPAGKLPVDIGIGDPFLDGFNDNPRADDEELGNADNSSK